MKGHPNFQGTEQRLLEWCNVHGLLGLLPHQTLSVTMPAHWVVMGRRQTSDTCTFPAVDKYSRVGPYWAALSTGDANRFQRNENEVPGLPVPLDEYSDSMARPRAIMQEIDSHQIAERDIESSWGRFFPSIPRDDLSTYNYPMPMSRQFWLLYAEPVREFLQGCASLYRVVEALRRLDDEPASDEETASMVKTLEILPRLLAPVAPALVREDDGKLAIKWNCGSLLSAYAMMAVIDIAGGQVPCRCPVCGKYFTRSARRTVYCSERCRQTAQKRAYRRNLKAKKGG
jgi:hypothetical protein